MGEALAIVRDGAIMGSDPWGGVFEGRFSALSVNRKHGFRIVFNVPPGGCLVTGQCAGEAGAAVAIEGELDSQGVSSLHTVDVGGAQVGVQLRYIGPLPVKFRRLSKVKPIV